MSQEETPILHESVKVKTFKVDITEALLATMAGNEKACEEIRKILYRRVDDFIDEAAKGVYS